MTRQVFAEDLETLRPYDGAPATMITEAGKIRAQARLEQIMATPPNVAPERFRRRTSAWKPMNLLRWAAIPAVAAVAFAIGTAIPRPAAPPAISDAQPPAVEPANPEPWLPPQPEVFATLAGWSPQPRAVPTSLLAIADLQCRGEMLWRAQPPQWQLDLGTASAPTDINQLSAPPVISEQRGEWALLGYIMENGQVASCLVWLAGPNGPDAQVLDQFAMFGKPVVGSPANVRGGANWGAPQIGATFGFEIPLPADISLTSQARGDYGHISAMRLRYSDEDISTMALAVAPDVTGVVLHTVQSGDVTASVAEGFALAWWPSTFDDEANALTVDGLTGLITGYTITRANGATETIIF